MANELHDTLARILSKSDVFVEKYKALSGERDRLAQQNSDMQNTIQALKLENEKLRQSNDYLKMARDIAPNQESVAQTRATISQIVRDIDKCIAQLNE